MDTYRARRGTINTYRLYQEVVNDVHARVENLRKTRFGSAQ
jgi:hypothetical protein